MSVSISNGSETDLRAIVEGGDAFMARAKTLADAKEAANESLARLKLGEDVVAAMQDVQRREQAVIDDMARAKDQAADIIAAAQARAAEIVSEAEAKVATLAREVDEGRASFAAWEKQVRTETENYVAEAKAAHAETMRIRAAVEQALRTIVPGNA